MKISNGYDNTKDIFKNKGIETYKEHRQEHDKDTGNQLFRFTAKTKGTAYSTLEDKIIAINLKLSDSDLPELKFDDGFLDQKDTLELLRNKNFLFLLQTDSTFEDGIKECCRKLEIEEKVSGMLSSNSEVTPSFVHLMAKQPKYGVLKHFV